MSSVERWNTGMLEYWNIGVMGASFYHSNTPSLHSPSGRLLQDLVVNDGDVAVLAFAGGPLGLHTVGDLLAGNLAGVLEVRARCAIHEDENRPRRRPAPR